MKQQCYLINIYLNWLVYAGGFLYLIYIDKLPFALFWIVWLPFTLWIYLRIFPSVSRWFGYGSVDDELAKNLESSLRSVTLYTSLGCPFCPIVSNRLESLKEEMGFELKLIDVTLRPELLRKKGIKAVPVVEIGERTLVGNATSLQLAQFISAGIDKIERTF